MKIFIVFLATCTFFISNSFAVKDGKTLYKKCRGCHGINGKHMPFEKQSGILAGRDKVELELIIKAMYDGDYPENRLNKIMQKAISKFSPEEIVILSEYIAQFKK